jgi:hypothetical protein
MADHTERTEALTEGLALPEEEQWRLINESGILKRLSRAPAPRSESVENNSDEEDTSTSDEIFNAVLLIIPFSFLLLLMEMYVKVLKGRRRLTLLLLAQSNPSPVWKAAKYPSATG